MAALDGVMPSNARVCLPVAAGYAANTARDEHMAEDGGGVLNCSDGEICLGESHGLSR